MVAVITMGMIMYPAGTVIDQVCRNDQDYARYQQPQLVFMKTCFSTSRVKPSEKSGRAEDYGGVFKPVIKRIGPHYKCQSDHSHFKTGIVNNIHSKQGQATQKQRQEGTMNGTGQ